MKELELTPKEIERAMDFWGCSAEQRKTLPAKLTPYQKKFIKHLDDFFNYKIIQEVTDVSVCAMRARVGGKIVYSAMGELLTEECTAYPEHRDIKGYCPFAVQEMLPLIYTVQDRIMAGCEDPSPIGLIHVRCIDEEPARGGTGLVRFKVYCIKEKVKVPEGMYRIKLGSRTIF